MKKTVLVTGASRGIGFETSLLFGKKGYNVAAVYKSCDHGAKDLYQRLLKAECNIKIYKSDITDFNQCQTLKNDVIKDFGSIDVIVNNAGVSSQNLITDVTTEEYDHIMDVNVRGVFNITKTFLPLLINKKCGKIINVSSIWGITGASCEVIYSTSKAAVIGFTKALAKEVGPSNIQVNCVAPGVITTDMNCNLDDNTLNMLKDETPLNRLGSCDDVAKSILFLASPDADFITGQVLSPCGGIVI